MNSLDLEKRPAMNELLALAVEPHGGLERWNQFERLQAFVTLGGAIWEFKQQPGLLVDKRFEIETHAQRITISPFPRAGVKSVFVPGRLQLETEGGELVESRNNPKRAYGAPTFQTPWDRLHVAYFASEALWTYLTLPFLYTYPGFVVEEIEPWHENGQVWRRLKARFPDQFESHTKEQTTYFGPDGLMRRHDYTVDILGGATGANYSTEYRDFQGIVMPTRRRIHAYDAQGQKVSEPLLVSLDFGQITFA